MSDEVKVVGLDVLTPEMIGDFWIKVPRNLPKLQYSNYSVINCSSCSKKICDITDDRTNYLCADFFNLYYRYLSMRRKELTLNDDKSDIKTFFITTVEIEKPPEEQTAFTESIAKGDVSAPVPSDVAAGTGSSAAAASTATAAAGTGGATAAATERKTIETETKVSMSASTAGDILNTVLAAPVHATKEDHFTLNDKVQENFNMMVKYNPGQIFCLFSHEGKIMIRRSENCFTTSDNKEIYCIMLCRDCDKEEHYNTDTSRNVLQRASQ